MTLTVNSDVGRTGVLLDGNTQLAAVLVVREYRSHYKVRINNLWAAGAEKYQYGQYVVVLKSNVALNEETNV